MPKGKKDENGGNGAGNGAGNGNGSKIKKRSFAQSRVEDKIDLGIVLTFAIQKTGQLTIPNLQQILDKWQAKASDKMVFTVLEMLRKKDHVAAEERGGEKFWSVKKLKFNTDLVEIAHVDAVITQLLSEPTGLLVKSEMEGLADKPKDKPVPAEMADVIVYFRLKTCLYGGYPYDGNPGFQAVYDQSNLQTFDRKDVEYPLCFERWGKDSIFIHQRHVSGWFESHVTALDVSRWSIKDCFLFGPIIHKPKRPLDILRLPIIAPGKGGLNGGGTGMSRHEVLLPGELVKLKFSIFTKNFVEEKKLYFFMKRILESPTRSMSPARGIQAGVGELLHFECKPWSILIDNEWNEFQKNKAAIWAEIQSELGLSALA